MRKFISVVLSCILLLTVFASCTNTPSPTPAPATATPAPAAATPAPAAATPAPAAATAAPAAPPEPPQRDKVTFTMGTDQINNTTDIISQYVFDALNIEIVPVIIENREMLSLMGATGDLPDLFGSESALDPNFYPWIEQGLIRELPWHLLEKYPNLMYNLNYSETSRTLINFLDNKVYFLPKPLSLDPGIGYAGNSRMYYRKDWVQNLGMTTPKTFDEFYELMRAFTEDDPDQNGVRDTVGLLSGGTWFMQVLITSYNGIDLDGWSKHDNEWVPGYYTTNSIPGIEFMQSMYSRGYIDPEYSVSTWTQALTKLGSHVGGACMRNGGDPYWLERSTRFYVDSNEGVSLEDAWNNHIGVMDPLIAPGNSRAYWPSRWEAYGFALNGNLDEAKLDRILEYMNWSMEPEQIEMARYGVEGETYVKGSDGRINQFIDPTTNETYALALLYPGSGFLNILQYDWGHQFNLNVPSNINRVFREASFVVNSNYDKAAMLYGDAYMLNIIRLPEMQEISSYVDYNTSYNLMIMGNRPVSDMFDEFRRECDSVGMKAAIQAVTAFMATQGL